VSGFSRTSPSADDTLALLRSWLDACLDETLGRAEGPAVWRAWRAFRDADVDALTTIDEEIVAIRPAGATRRSTRAMGLRLLTTWQALYPDPRVEELLAIPRRQPARAREAVVPGETGALAGEQIAEVFAPAVATGRSKPAPSLPVAFAIACASSGVGRRESVEAFVYTRLASTISAAMRLMPLGQTDARTVLARALDRAPSVVDAIERGRDTIECFTPAMDVAMMSQQYLHSRLFRS